MTSSDATAQQAPEVAAPDGEACHYYTTYTGVKMPFKLVEPIPQAQLTHRNTFIRAYFDQAGRLSGFDKMVYGEIELAHRYVYYASGALQRAEVTMDEETVVLSFDEAGAPVSAS